MSEFQYYPESDLIEPISITEVSKIMSYNVANSVEVLRSKIDLKEIDLSPEFQRDFVWDINRASLFIDSLLIGLPIPSIFLGKTRKDESFLVIDGQQRLKSIYFFLNGKFQTRGSLRPFRLKNLVERPWNNQTYEELEETYKRRFRNAILNTTIVEDIDINPKIIHDLFHRLNTGGMPLKDQEIRHCIYAGSFSTFLHALNLNSNWRLLLGKPYMDKRLSDVELILRFFALLFNLEKYSPSMREYLSYFMATNQNNLNIEKDYEEIFKCTVDIIMQEIGEKTFRQKKLFNKAVCDSIMVAVASGLLNGYQPDNLSSRYMKLLDDYRYNQFIERSTTQESNVKGRIDLAKKYLLGENHDI